MSVPTPHISAKKEDFAKTVLMPGDPQRSRFIAENYLENAVLVNDIRGVQGYTGYYKGKRVSVMASGMGQPAIGIYSYELFNFYDVSSIIRVGSCGSFREDLHVHDIVLAMGACTDSNFAAQYKMNGTFAPIADFSLLKKAAAECERRGIRYQVGNMYSTDVFYNDTASGIEWAKLGVLGVEMESAALYCNAARAGKKALCICTVSDSFITPEQNISAEERRTSFTKMMEIALETAEDDA
ncbi:MAG: purine-nucleoside phosphorylase [Ruminococcaceae bacterium]|nr:purine-nucleoside phosphorylase [Oscillospiraceae bacterium]